ncbi:cyclophane-forming radical SAM/SPASM peptide maturase GrrM/OscB [Dictyobacter kobayashii]|uniref:Radical SAM protein n=1 Tax=Dictyobacter kobayashii TaxID=2014872 RepID=A0A402AY08_9CHLR|nr:cyclophane-forming radical SAM/SPASM peptide maturase GrrM/OscB [Dictyobacter kobayashii]GCE23944.1 radical SAM protein [Dictyobacter kobayashii]
MKTKLVVIQPSPLCNIDCRYCYLPQRMLKKRIQFNTLERIFQALFSSALVGDDVTCIWHAGEPLVLPIEFYREAFRLQQQCNIHNVHITNVFQTNATLINQPWCDFFQEALVEIGVSIDGPQRLHDAQRVDLFGRGTFERVMRGIRLLQENEIRFTTISVISEETTRHPEEFFDFFSELQPVRLGLNPEEMEGSHGSSSLYSATGLLQYKSFVKRLIELNQHAQQPVSIREIDFMLYRIQSAHPHIFAETNTPATILNFDCDGNISTFSPELLTITHPTYQDFFFGNVHTIAKLDDLFQHPKFLSINADIQRGVSRCQASCDYFQVCGGGAPSNKLHENGTFDSTETHACRLQVKMTMDALLEHLEKKYYLDSPPDVQ